MKFTKDTYHRPDGRPWLSEDDGVFGIEPGDITHYTIDMGPRLAVFYVGRNLSDADSTITVVDLATFSDHPHAYHAMAKGPRARDEYEVPLAIFFIGLLMGLEMEEPDCLAFRRRP